MRDEYSADESDTEKENHAINQYNPKYKRENQNNQHVQMNRYKDKFESS